MARRNRIIKVRERKMSKKIKGSGKNSSSRRSASYQIFLSQNLSFVCEAPNLDSTHE